MMADLYHGDCLEVMAGLPDNSVDLTVTSPPYDNLRTYNGFTFDFEGIARELYRVTKPGGVVVWVVGDATIKGSETGTSFRQALYFKDVCGFNLHDTMIYRKKNPVPCKSTRCQPCYEFMFVLTKGPPSTFNAPVVPAKGVIGGSRQRKRDGSLQPFTSGATGKTTKVRENIWDYSLGEYRQANLRHPAPFPESLAADHIATWSSPGDVVMDPFLGSGTTGKMAVQMGRQFIGIEISSEYLAIASERIAASERLFA